MAIKTTGPLSMKEIQAEFGGPTTNIKMSDYFRGGANVPAGTAGVATGRNPGGTPIVDAPAGAGKNQKFSYYYGTQATKPASPFFRPQVDGPAKTGVAIRASAGIGGGTNQVVGYTVYGPLWQLPTALTAALKAAGYTGNVQGRTNWEGSLRPGKITGTFGMAPIAMGAYQTQRIQTGGFTGTIRIHLDTIYVHNSAQPPTTGGVIKDVTWDMTIQMVSTMPGVIAPSPQWSGKFIGPVSPQAQVGPGTAQTIKWNNNADKWNAMTVVGSSVEYIP